MPWLKIFIIEGVQGFFGFREFGACAFELRVFGVEAWGILGFRGFMEFPKISAMCYDRGVWFGFASLFCHIFTGC